MAAETQLKSMYIILCIPGRISLANIVPQAGPSPSTQLPAQCHWRVWGYGLGWFCQGRFGSRPLRAKGAPRRDTMMPDGGEAFAADVCKAAMAIVKATADLVSSLRTLPCPWKWS